MPDPEVKHLDLATLLKKYAEGVLSDVSFAYPGGWLEESRCHGALQKIKARTQGLQDVLESIQ